MSTETQYTPETGQEHVLAIKADDQPISEAVIEAVAAVEGVPPTEFTPRLYDSIDSEALDILYRTTLDRSSHLTITFTFAGYEVSIDGENTIHVRE